MDPDTEGLFGVVSLVAGATAIAGSYLLQYLYDITTKGALNLMKVPQFRNFGPELKSFLSTQPNQSSVVLIEGSVKQLSTKLTVNGKFIGAGYVALTTAIFRTEYDDIVSRTIECQQDSIPFALSDSYNNSIVVHEIHKSIGFKQLLKLVNYEGISKESNVLPLLENFEDTQVTPQHIPVYFEIKKYSLTFGKYIGSFGRACLLD